MDTRRRSGTAGHHQRPQFDDYGQPVQDYTAADERRRSFSERAGSYFPDLPDNVDASHDHPERAGEPLAPNGRPRRENSRRVREPQAALHVPKPRHQVSDAFPEDRRERRRTANEAQPPNDVHATSRNPRNDRPTVQVPDSQTRRDHHAQVTPTSAGPRRAEQRKGSVPGRSPLQKLEGKLGDISKEEKRARMMQAEHRAQQAGQRGRRDRIVSDPAYHQNGNERLQQREGRESDAAAGLHGRHGRQSTAARDDLTDRRNGTAYEGGLDGREPLPSAHNFTEPQNGGTNDGQSRFRRASEALRAHGTGHSPENDISSGTDPASRHHTQHGANEGVVRSNSKDYRHRSRDAGYAGAAAAFAGAAANTNTDGIERRESRRRSGDYAPANRDEPQRSTSKRFQQEETPGGYQTGNRNRDRMTAGQQQLQSHRAGAKEGLKAAVKHQDPDPLPPGDVLNPRGEGPAYQVPPQTAAGQAARDQVGFNTTEPINAQTAQRGRHNKFHEIFHHHEDRSIQPYRQAPALEEWREAGTAKLNLEDLMLDQSKGNSRDDNTWWEQNERERRQSSGRREVSGSYDGAYEEEATAFRPPLYLKCGPLLRYTGQRRERRGQSGQSAAIDRCIWRGSVMIVTSDSQSSYESTPVLRLFAQSMDLASSAPSGDFGHHAPEYMDHIAGQTKLSRTGRALYVKPVDELNPGVDLSRVEGDDGLFERTKPMTLAPRQVAGRDTQQRSHIASTPDSRVRARDGEKLRKYREVKGVRLHAERGSTFWRFNIEIELGSSQARVAYRINRGPALGFWVPARNQTMNMMFHTCNGFSLSVDPNTFSGPDPLWRDVLNKHQEKPFHVMIGGGDQIYNDRATRDTELFAEWLQIKNPEHKHRAEFSPNMQDELETFYLDRYSMWFSQGLFSMANSQIPMINMWDDHDIIDGFGSYPHHFMASKVFAGVGAVAFKYYMLFQHQSVVSETYREEPSWLLGASPGPYINEYSRSIFVSLGPKIAFLGLDCRTERMKDEILSQESYDLILSRCRAEIIKAETKHLIVLLGVPIAYPRLNFLENVLTSKLMDPVKALGRTGALGGFVNKFDGGVEILDDLDDHWTAKHHKQERNWFIQELQELAAEKSVRVTILGGDVHLAAVGQFYTAKKFGVPKDQDHRYMPNVISSAIVNTPPPEITADVLNKRNKIHHLDAETDEDMIPMFEHDVNGKRLNNTHLLPRRNYCTIKEYIPGDTPPPTPPPEDRPGSSRLHRDQDHNETLQERDRRFPPGSMGRGERTNPPGSMGRSRSLTRESLRPRNIIRRLSGSQSRNGPVPLQPEHTRAYEDAEPPQRAFSIGGRPGNSRQEDGSYFPQRNSSVRSATNSHPTARPGFHRRPTLTGKAASRAAAKGGADGNLDGRDPDHIDLEGGLNIALHVEVDQHDPAGHTEDYRLLVPALFYEGRGDVNTSRFKTRRASFMDRFRGKRHRRDSMSDRSYSGSESGRSRSPSPNGRHLDQHHPGGRVPAGGPMAGGAMVAGALPHRTSHGAGQAEAPGHRNAEPLAGAQQATAHNPRRTGASDSGAMHLTNGRSAQNSGRAGAPHNEVAHATAGHHRTTQDTNRRGPGDVPAGAQRLGHNPYRRNSGSGQVPYVDGTSEPRGHNNYGPYNAGLPKPSYSSANNTATHDYANSPGTNRTAPLPRPSADMDRPNAETIEPKKRGGIFASLKRGLSGRGPRDRDEGYGRERYGDDSESDGSLGEERYPNDRRGDAQQYNDRRRDDARYPDDEGFDDQSVLSSEFDDVDDRQRAPPVRRQSKAEKFFGVGDEKVWGGGRAGGEGAGRRVSSAGGEGGYEGDGKKSSWKIWK